MLLTEHPGLSSSPVIWVNSPCMLNGYVTVAYMGAGRQADLGYAPHGVLGPWCGRNRRTMMTYLWGQLLLMDQTLCQNQHVIIIVISKKNIFHKSIPPHLTRVILGQRRLQRCPSADITVADMLGVDVIYIGYYRLSAIQFDGCWWTDEFLDCLFSYTPPLIGIITTPAF